MNVILYGQQMMMNVKLTPIFALPMPAVSTLLEAIFVSATKATSWSTISVSVSHLKKCNGHATLVDR